MRLRALLLTLIITPALCWGQTLPSSANQQTSPLNIHNERTDVFGRLIITDPVFYGLYSLFPSAFPVDIDEIKGFQLIFGLTEQYNSNLNLSRDNRKDDFITTVGSGFRYNRQDPKAGIDLAYVLGYNIYAKNSDLDYLGHTASLNSYYKPNANFTVAFRDALIRNDDPLETDPLSPNQYFISTATQRSPYIRNVAESQIEYRFGPENHLGLLYRNIYFANEAADVSDGMEQTINPRLIYWLDVHNGIMIDYLYTWVEMTASPDWTGNDVRGRYIYRFSPITSVFGEYYFGNRLFDPPSVNYSIYSPAVGIEHLFSPNLYVLLRIGYLEMRPDQGNAHHSPVLNLTVMKRTELSTYSLSILSGFREDYLSPQNLGYADYKRLDAEFLHRFRPMFTMLLSGSIEKADFTNNADENIYSISAGLSWNPLKRLYIGPTLLYRNVDSDNSSDSHWEFRGILKLSWIY